MKKIKLGIILAMLFSLISCDSYHESDNSFPSASESISCESESLSEISESSFSEEIKEYEKDENGFYILEDDYFKNDSIDDGKSESKIRFSDFISEEYEYKQMKLFVGDKQIPLYNCKTNMSQNWHPLAPSRMNNSVAIMELEGKVTLKLQTSFAIFDQCVIRPLASNIIPTIDDNRRVITFEISSAGQYCIELRSGRTLHLFVNEYKEFEEHKNDDNLIYFKEGIHNKDNNQYINNNNVINVPSNSTVYVEYGAIIQGTFAANNKNNIKIVGGGIIDGSTFERDANKNIQTIPYDFNYCNNITFKGIATLDPAGWCYNIYFCKDVYFDNIKIISSRSNGDGVSIQSCINVLCEDSFVRSWDDSLVVKNYPKWSNKNEHGTTQNIVFEDCILWTDLAQSMEVGFETIGKVMEDITFNNITILHNYHKAPISIHNGNNANLKNVKFTNITIEDAAMGGGDGNKYLIDFSTEFSTTWSTKHTVTELGSISNVLVDNVLVIHCIDDALISIIGCVDTRKGYNNSEHYINDVIIKNVKIKDEIINDSYENLDTYMVNNLTFINDKEVTGSNINYHDTSSYGNKYSIEII